MMNMRVFALAAVLALCASSVAAQPSIGGIVDSAKDAAGAVIDKAQQGLEAAQGALGGAVDTAVEAEEGVTSDEEPDSIVEAVVGAQNATILLAAVKAAGLDVGPLADPTFNATVFAPTDAAFEAAIEALGVTAEDLLNNTDLLTEVLSYHVVPGAAILSGDLTDGAIVQTLVEGPAGELKVDLSDPAAPKLITTSGQSVAIIGVDAPAGAAVIHTIDGVLLPGNQTFTAEA